LLANSARMQWKRCRRPARTQLAVCDAPGGVPPAQELMQPNDMFAELVKAGRPTGGLRAEDLCVLAALGCGG